MSMGNPGLLEIGLDIYEGCGLADQVMSWNKWPGENSLLGIAMK
jgi:hypothetical protein